MPALPGWTISSKKWLVANRLATALPAYSFAPRARGARGVDLRIFGSRAEAAADTKPPRRGMQVIRIITGVRRSLDASPARLDDMSKKWLVANRLATALRAYSFAPRARGARGVDLRIFGSRAEAAADTKPPLPGTTVVRIVNGRAALRPCWRGMTGPRGRRLARLSKRYRPRRPSHVQSTT